MKQTCFILTIAASLIAPINSFTNELDDLITKPKRSYKPERPITRSHDDLDSLEQEDSKFDRFNEKTPCYYLLKKITMK